jgi:hypothetical protein
MVPVEIETVFRSVYANSRTYKPIYHFYTFFDQALAMLVNF